MMRLLFSLLLIAIATHSQAQYFDTLHLHYAIGESAPGAADRHRLDSLTQHAAGRKILIYSYADYLGSESPNQHLSDRRAFTVRDYLLGKGWPAAQIMECTGLGRIPGAGGSAGDPESRRTDIFIRTAATGSRTEPTHSKIVKKSAEPVKEAGKGIPVAVDDAEDKAPPVAPGITPINLDSMQVGDTLRLSNINYYPGSAEALPSSYPELDNLYRVMRDNPALKIRLEGHVCCCVYPDGFFEDTPTWGLSVDRAFMVYKFLVKRGIAPARMLYKGFGRTHPIRDNERTPEEGAVNRRVEIRILEK